VYVKLALAYSAAMTESGSCPITGTGVVVIFWGLVADDELTNKPPEVLGAVARCDRGMRADGRLLVVPVMFPDP